MSNYICAYGTLRKNQPNYYMLHSRYGEQSFQYLKKLTLYGYAMYDLIYYPACVLTNDMSDKIQVELFRCDDRSYDYISAMEKAAGYYEDIVWVDDVAHSIFLMPSIDTRYDMVEGGDWVENNQGYIL